MVVDGDGQFLFRLLLPDHVLIEEVFTSWGFGNWLGVVEGGVAARSSSRIELHTATHSSQM